MDLMLFEQKRRPFYRVIVRGVIDRTVLPQLAVLLPEGILIQPIDIGKIDILYITFSTVQEHVSKSLERVP